MTRYLSLEGFVVELEAIGFHVGDLGLVHSAIERPATTLMGTDAYPSLDAKAAAMTESLTRNHPFVDGTNDRLGSRLTTFFESMDTSSFRPRTTRLTTFRVLQPAGCHWKVPPHGSKHTAVPFDLIPRRCSGVLSK